MEGEKDNNLPLNATDLISALYLKYHDNLEKYARRIGYTKEEAEDLVQDTFAVVVQKWETLLESESRQAWIFGILRKCMGHLNRDAQYASRLQEMLEWQLPGVNEDQLDLVTSYRGIVSDEDLELLIQHCANKVSYESLSRKYGISEPACRKRVQRARERFRQTVGKDGSSYALLSQHATASAYWRRSYHRQPR